jgi:small-conductance mechanosensitive channel
MDPKQELSAELRKARGWILAVGIIMFVVDTVLIQVVQKNQIPDVWRTRFLIVDLVILSYFVFLFFLAKAQPKLACVLALVGYWGLQIGVAAWIGDFTSLFTQGIVIKILFTVALVNGLKSANRAQMLKSELENVFG